MWEIFFCFWFVTFIGVGKCCVTLVTVDWFSLLTAPTRVSWCYRSSSTWHVSSIARRALSGLNSWTSIIRGKAPFLREVYRALQTEERYIWFRAIFWPLCVLVYVGLLLVKLAECVQFSLYVTEGLCLLVFIKVLQTKVLSKYTLEHINFCGY
jgi:hypothetical protein